MLNGNPASGDILKSSRLAEAVSQEVKVRDGVQPMRKDWWDHLMLWCLILLAGVIIPCCSNVPLANFESEASEILGEKKPGSFRYWEKRHVNGESAENYAANRTSPLFAGTISIEVANVTVDKTNRTGSANLYIKGTDIDLGAATEITNDGYYLTAAHCVDQQPLHILIGDEEGMTQVQARIVWKGAAFSTREPDLAIIHIPHRSSKYFTLGDGAHLQAGQKIFSAGYGSYGAQRRFIQYSGGRVQTLKPWKQSKSGARWMEIQHSAPLSTGDSGGPVIDAEGRLAGINTEISLGFTRMFNRGFLRDYNSTAICPDPKWIHRLIEEDRVVQMGYF